MIYKATTELLSQGEFALKRRDLASLLPVAAALEPRVTSPDDGQMVYDFFTRLTHTVICSPELHIRLFTHCLDAVIAYDPMEGAAFLEKMLCLTDGIQNASSAPLGIVH